MDRLASALETPEAPRRYAERGGGEDEDVKSQVPCRFPKWRFPNRNPTKTHDLAVPHFKKHANFSK